MAEPTDTFLDDISLKNKTTELRQVFRKLPKWLLVSIAKEASSVRRQKYSSKVKSLTGDRNKAIPYTDLQRLFSCTQVNTSWKVYFGLSLFYGLRASELSSLSFEEKYYHRVQGGYVDAITFWNKKAGRSEALPFNPDTKRIWALYCEMKKEGLVYSAPYCNKIFQQLREELGGAFQRTVGKTRDGRTKYLHSFHSFRHSATQIFAKYVQGDPFKVAKFRHDSTSNAVGVQSVYRHYDWFEFKTDVKNAFRPYKGLLRGL